jgi:hypothetical protein
MAQARGSTLAAKLERFAEGVKKHANDPGFPAIAAICDPQATHDLLGTALAEEQAVRLQLRQKAGRADAVTAMAAALYSRMVSALDAWAGKTSSLLVDFGLAPRRSPRPHARKSKNGAPAGTGTGPSTGSGTGTNSGSGSGAGSGGNMAAGSTTGGGQTAPGGSPSPAPGTDGTTAPVARKTKRTPRLGVESLSADDLKTMLGSSGVVAPPTTSAAQAQAQAQASTGTPGASASAPSSPPPATAPASPAAARKARRSR